MSCSCNNKEECEIPYVREKGGRMFSICNGSSGMPKEKRQKYIDLFLVKSEMLPEEEDREVKKEPLSKYLGDVIETTLSAIGITEEKMNRIAEWVGVSGCGCKARKEKINKLHKWANEMLAGNKSEEPFSE
jgi:hypothetical protein